MNALLTILNPSAEGIMLAVYYGVCALVIIVALIITASLKRKQKKELSGEAVKKHCLKAKKIAEEMLDDGNGTNLLLGSTKLLNLSKSVANASWYAFQIYEEKRDLLFEGIANSLDSISSELSADSEMGFVPKEAYLEDVKKTIEALDAAIAKVDSVNQ